jgi:hypothetical protein
LFRLVKFTPKKLKSLKFTFHLLHELQRISMIRVYLKCLCYKRERLSKLPEPKCEKGFTKRRKIYNAEQ